MKLNMLIRPQQIRTVVVYLATRIRDAYQQSSPLVVPVLEGARPFLRTLIEADMTYPIAPIKVSSYVGTESRELKLSDAWPVPAVAGQTVVILEDIIDSGQTVDFLRRLFLDAGAASVDVCSLLLKDCERKYPVTVRFSGFFVPDKFVVGFGLDFNGEFRDLPAIYTLEE